MIFSVTIWVAFKILAFGGYVSGILWSLKCSLVCASLSTGRKKRKERKKGMGGASKDLLHLEHNDSSASAIGTQLYSLFQYMSILLALLFNGCVYICRICASCL